MTTKGHLGRVVCRVRLFLVGNGGSRWLWCGAFRFDLGLVWFGFGFGLIRVGLICCCSACGACSLFVCFRWVG